MISRTGIRRNSGTRRATAPGFTLIELMLVMTILVVVVAVAAPSLAGFFRGRSMESEARRLLALTRQGQSRAVFEGVPMLLWMDEKRRTYGLEEEPGFTQQDDPKAVEFTLSEELGLEPMDPLLFSVQRSLSSFGQTTLPTEPVVERVHPLAARGRHANLPAIRFLPDGSFGPSSPAAFRLFDADGAELWLAQSRNRLSYEIRHDIDELDEPSR